MLPSQTLSWARARAGTRLHDYRVFLGICLAIDVLVGLTALVAPESVARQLMLPEPFPTLWVRTSGALLIGTSLLIVPGWRDPLFYRWPNWSGIVVRFLLMLVFASEGNGFLLCTLWELISATLLFVLYYRLWLADLGTHP
jgi:hypothetical protein